MICSAGCTFGTNHIKENDEMHNCAYSVRSKALKRAFGGAMSVVGGRAFCFPT